MKKWTEGFLAVWSMEHCAGTAFAEVGRLKGYFERKAVINDTPARFIACGTSWDDVARRLKATWPESRQLDHPPVILSDAYWDCECELDYIHPNDDLRCARCKAVREDQPPSRVNEVELMFPTSERVI